MVKGMSIIKKTNDNPRIDIKKTCIKYKDQLIMTEVTRTPFTISYIPFGTHSVITKHCLRPKMMPKNGYDKITRQPSCLKKDIPIDYKRKTSIRKRGLWLDFWLDSVQVGQQLHTAKTCTLHFH